MDKNKIKIFTHVDLDGVASPEVFKRLMNEKHCREFDYEIEYCDTGKYGNIDDKIYEFLDSLTENHEFYGMYIMDLAPTSRSLALKIVKMVDAYNIDFKCYDHHKTAEFLTDVDPRFIIKVEYEGSKMSGTSLVYKDFSKAGLLDYSVFMLSEMVRSYDTWDWRNNEHDMFKGQAGQWNDLFWMIGRDRFIERLSNNMDLNFTESEKLLLVLDQEKKDRYIDSKMKIAHFDTMFTVGKPMHFALVDGEQYHSELGNHMCLYLTHPSTGELIDFAVIRNGVKLSFRSVKEDVDCSVIAQNFNGGGHARAAGGKGQQWPLGF